MQCVAYFNMIENKPLDHGLLPAYIQLPQSLETAEHAHMAELGQAGQPGCIDKKTEQAVHRLVEIEYSSASWTALA